MTKQRSAPRRLSDCLATDSAVAPLAQHAKRLLRARRVFAQSAPPLLVANARIANYRLGRLFVFADNNAVANKLKHLIPSLTQAMRVEYPELTEIVVQTQPRPTNPAMENNKIKQPLGIAPKQALTDLLRSLPESSALRASLQQLLVRSE